MKNVFIAFFFFCSLTGCTPAPMASFQSSNTTLVVHDGVRVYEKVKPFVVNVQEYIPTTNEWFTIGTAFIVDFKGKQIILTAKHVCSDAEALYRITTAKGETYSITEVKASETEDDISMLTLEKPLSFKKGLSLAGKNPKIGAEVYHIGNPLGLSWSITDGIVMQYEGNTLVTTAPLAPGSSGGVLVDKDGKVVGCTFAVNTQWKQFNFCVPVEIIKDFISK